MKHRNLVALVCLSSLGLLGCTVSGQVSAGHHHEPAAPPMGPPGAAPVADANAEAEVVCTHEDLKIVGKRIQGSGVGVLLAGSCDIVLEDCVIDAGTWGIVSRGSGDIVLVNSYVRGGVGAVSQSGSGDISASNTRFVGMVEKSGSGDFSDGGGNAWDNDVALR